MTIGLTGLIGSGKSTAARILEKLGAVVIDADRIGHDVVRDSGPLRRRLARAFGSDIFDSRNRLIRKKLAARAFADQGGKDTLNSLVHPYLLKELRRRVKEASRTRDVVIDAALLLHWNMDSEVDLVLVIHAGENIRFSRMAERGITLADARARQRAQLPYREFRERADRLILNNRTTADLERKLRSFWTRRIAERH